MEIQYLDPKVLELLKQNLKMSPETWHKVMNPLCAKCLIERGRNSTLAQWVEK